MDTMEQEMQGEGGAVVGKVAINKLAIENAAVEVNLLVQVEQTSVEDVFNDSPETKAKHPVPGDS